VDILTNDKRTSSAITEALVFALEHAESYNQANTIAGFLAQHPASVTKSQLTRLRKAQKQNGQVADAWHVNGHLRTIERLLGSDD
jgi:hypothetical protein